MLLAAMVFCIYAGLGALAFATRKHYARATGAPIQRLQQIVLRVAGWVLLGVALAAGILRDGPAFGPLLWISFTGVLGVALVLLLAYRPRAVFLGSGAAALSCYAGSSRAR
jgi:hypothetical protein